MPLNFAMFVDFFEREVRSYVKVRSFGVMVSFSPALHPL